MAVIQCEDCGEKVSSRAQNCPHCGCPISEQLEANWRAPRVQTIERTSKLWKGQVILAWCLGIFGLLTLFGGGGKDSLIVIGIAIVWWAFAKSGAYWRNG